MKETQKFGLFFGMIALLALLLTACQTVHGFGKDVQSGGKVISRASRS